MARLRLRFANRAIKNDKEIIREKLLNCGKFSILCSKYSNSENYYGTWYAFSRVIFLNNEVTIEVAHYSEESSKIKPSMPPGTEKYVYTLSILDIRARTIKLSEERKKCKYRHLSTNPCIEGKCQATVEEVGYGCFPTSNIMDSENRGVLRHDGHYIGLQYLDCRNGF